MGACAHIHRHFKAKEMEQDSYRPSLRAQAQRIEHWNVSPLASQAKGHIGDVQPAEHCEERCRCLRDAHGQVQKPAQLDAVLKLRLAVRKLRTKRAILSTCHG